jgi:hypothetical protein
MNGTLGIQKDECFPEMNCRSSKRRVISWRRLQVSTKCCEELCVEVRYEYEYVHNNIIALWEIKIYQNYF